AASTSATGLSRSSSPTARGTKNASPTFATSGRALHETWPMTARADCLHLDAGDPLWSLADLFELPPGVIYLDGNSLGPLPRSAPARLREVACDEWGRGLIRSWNTAGWIDLPQRVGDKIARLV